MAKYKVGDKVRIVSERPESLGFTDEMVRFLGKILTVKSVATIYGRTRYYFEKAHAENPIMRKTLEAIGVPGYYFLEDWISGPAEEAPEEPVSVHIRFCGNVTVAELIKDGKVVKVENARCNPKDEYSRSEGARIAVQRLFKKKPTGKAKEVSKPKVGDKFVVTGNTYFPRHYFNIGEIVTFTDPVENETGWYRNERGKEQIVSNLDVKPYKEGKA